MPSSRSSRLKLRRSLNSETKVKFPRGVVVATFQNWWQAFSYIVERRPSKATDSIAKGRGPARRRAGTPGTRRRAGTRRGGEQELRARGGEQGLGHAAASGNTEHAAASRNLGTRQRAGTRHAAASRNRARSGERVLQERGSEQELRAHAAASRYYRHAAASRNYGHAAASRGPGTQRRAGTTGTRRRAGTQARSSQQELRARGGEQVLQARGGERELRHTAASGYYRHAAASRNSGTQRRAELRARSGERELQARSGERVLRSTRRRAGTQARSGERVLRARGGEQELGHAAASRNSGWPWPQAGTDALKAGGQMGVLLWVGGITGKRPRLAIGYVGEGWHRRDTWYVVRGRLVKTTRRVDHRPARVKSAVFTRPAATLHRGPAGFSTIGNPGSAVCKAGRGLNGRRCTPNSSSPHRPVRRMRSPARDLLAGSKRSTRPGADAARVPAVSRTWVAGQAGRVVRRPGPVHRQHAVETVAGGSTMLPRTRTVVAEHAAGHAGEAGLRARPGAGGRWRREPRPPPSSARTTSRGSSSRTRASGCRLFYWFIDDGPGPDRRPTEDPAPSLPHRRPPDRPRPDLTSKHRRPHETVTGNRQRRPQGPSLRIRPAFLRSIRSRSLFSPVTDTPGGGDPPDSAGRTRLRQAEENFGRPNTRAGHCARITNHQTRD